MNQIDDEYTTWDEPMTNKEVAIAIALYATSAAISISFLIWLFS